MPPRSEHGEPLKQLYVAMYAVIRRIPRGRVTTYGQVAELAGLPGGARIAAASLKVSKPEHQLPWQRVIGKASGRRGRIAIHDPVGAAIQRGLLEKEGVAIGDTGLIALDVFGWTPIRSGSDRAASPRPQPRSASKRRASSSPR